MASSFMERVLTRSGLSRPLTALAGAVVLGSRVGCVEESSKVTEAREVFTVVAPQRADAAYEREYVGEVHAVRYAEIRSRLKGIIDSVAIDEGQAVSADQRLFTISALELQQEVLKARAAIKSAQADLRLAHLEQESTRLLFDKHVVSDAEMALATAKIESFKAKLEETKAIESQASITLTYAQLRAPFDGVVNRLYRKAGSVADENDLLTTITDTSEVYVYFRVSEREYLTYAAAAPEDRPTEVSLKLADGRLHSSRGVIDAIETEFNKETGNLAFRARFPNPDRTLKHGSSGKVVIESYVRGALLVPQKSTFEVQGKLFVYTVDANNNAHAREIVPALRVKDAFVVASGLAADDRFVLEGIQKLKEGARIETVPLS